MFCGIFAWGFFFVVIFIYFIDSSFVEFAFSFFLVLEIRRLLFL